MHGRVPSVVPDEERGGYEATKILLEKGHQRVGFVNIHRYSDGIPASIGRQDGYRRALEEADIGYDEVLVRYGMGNHQDGYKLTYDLMRNNPTMTAIFAANDRTAMGVYDALREMGKRIPDDVAVIGFDNQDIIATALRPSLSTMQLPHYAMGYWAASYLINPEARNEAALNGGQHTVHRLNCPYVSRESL